MIYTGKGNNLIPQTGMKGQGLGPRTFSMSLSLARLVPLPPAGTDEVRSSLPLPEPNSEPWPRRVLPVDLGGALDAVAATSSRLRLAASSRLSSVSLRNRS